MKDEFFYLTVNTPYTRGEIISFSKATGLEDEELKKRIIYYSENGFNLKLITSMIVFSKKSNEEIHFAISNLNEAMKTFGKKQMNVVFNAIKELKHLKPSRK